MLCESPAGDGYGADNTFINFDFTDSRLGDDIGGLISTLKFLSNRNTN